jgi:hypothetical protein
VQHRAVVLVLLQPAAPAAAAAISRPRKGLSCSSMPGSKPIVLFLSLEDCSEQLLKGVHGQLLHTLDDHCTVKIITTKKEARAALEDPQVCVAIANDKMAAVVTKPFLQRGEAGGAMCYHCCNARSFCNVAEQQHSDWGMAASCILHCGILYLSCYVAKAGR